MNSNRSSLPKSEVSSVSWSSYFILFLIAIFIILLLIFLIQYVRSSCSETEKKNFWDYLATLDPSSSPCKEPVPEVKFEEREEKNEDEVWHIQDQIYTYPEAIEKCKAYDSRLATKKELIKAYNKGAQWTTYGWSEGKEAYYPIQPCEFVKLRRQGIAIGPPGVNGGKFDSHLRFGANCYGVKPPGEIVHEKSSECPWPSVCQRNPEVCEKSKSDHISPFFPGKTWSVWDNQ
jgi:hypothetical protein